MVTGVRTFRDAERGRPAAPARRSSTSSMGSMPPISATSATCSTQDSIREFGHVDIVCLGIGPQLGAAQAAELVTQLDATLVVPLPLSDAAAAPMATWRASSRR